MPNGVGEFIHYSPMLDNNVARLSLDDGRGGELYTTIPHVPGKAYRQARENAVNMLFEARDLGMAPGEVTMDRVEAEIERRRVEAERKRREQWA